MIITRKNGGFWSTTIVLNDEYSIVLSGHESRTVDIPEETEELTIEVDMSGTRGCFKAKHVNKIKEITFELKMWSAIFFGMTPDIICNVVFKDGSEMHLLNKKTGSEIDANFNRINLN